MFLQAVQDIRVGGRQSNAQYQYTLQGDNLTELYAWGPRILAALQALPQLADVNSDQQNKGLETELTIDRDIARGFGISASTIDNTLYDAFGQRHVSTIYSARNQYHVVMEVAPEYWQRPDTLEDIYLTNPAARSGAVDQRGRREPAGFRSPTSAITGPIASRSRSITRACWSRLRSRSTFRPNRIGVPGSIHGTFQGHRAPLRRNRSPRAGPDPSRGPRGLHRARDSF